MLFPAKSLYEFAFTDTFCIQLFSFLTNNVYCFVFLTLKSLDVEVPFSICISSKSNPFISSLNVNVYVISDAFVGDVGFAVISHVGIVLSIIIEILFATF